MDHDVGCFGPGAPFSWLLESLGGRDTWIGYLLYPETPRELVEAEILNIERYKLRIQPDIQESLDAIHRGERRLRSLFASGDRVRVESLALDYHADSARYTRLRTSLRDMNLVQRKIKDLLHRAPIDQGVAVIAGILRNRTTQLHPIRYLALMQDLDENRTRDSLNMDTFQEYMVDEQEREDSETLSLSSQDLVAAVYAQLNLFDLPSIDRDVA